MLWKWWNIFDPLSLSPALFLDRKRSGFVLENTDRITQWNDISGNNNHATAATGSAARPTLGTDGVVFDGVGNSLLTNILITQPYTVFGVVQYDADVTINAVLLRISTVAPTHLVYSNTELPSDLRVFMPSGGIANYLCDFGTTRNVQTFVVNSASSFIGLNGVGSTVALGLDNPANSTCYIGENSGIPRFYMKGTVSSLLIFPRALTDSERVQCEKFLAKEYSITL